jgi:CDGSH iron-sulfur domain-containing protein 3
MKMKALENGPIIFEIKGKSKIIQSGVEKKLESPTIALCRCGQSKKSPFCDGSHVKTNFKAEAAELEIK